MNVGLHKQTGGRGSQRRYGWVRCCALALLPLCLMACSPRQMIVRGMADELASQGQAPESDLLLARDAAPFYLKLSESVLRGEPGHWRLAESVSAGFVQYAYAFVAFEADRIESRDAKAAEQLRQRAAQLYQRAQQHAATALFAAYPTLATALPQPGGELPALRPEHVGLAYWLAAAWGGRISLSKDDPDVVADLPQVVRLARWAWACDSAWGQGALTGLLATLEASRPGGSPTQALAWFDQAIAQAGEGSAAPLVAKAEGWALPAHDRAAFESLLRQALSGQPPANRPSSLSDAVMRQRAAWLLEQAPDLF